MPGANLKTSLHGRRFGLGNNDELVSNETQITQPAVDVIVTVAASQTSPRAVTLQCNNSDGTPINYRQMFEAYLLADATPSGLAATGGSTGLAADAAHGWDVPFTLISSQKLGFLAVTDATGKWTGTWTDTAHEVCFLGVVLPNGRLVISPALTTA